MKNENTLRAGNVVIILSSDANSARQPSIAPMTTCTKTEALPVATSVSFEKTLSPDIKHLFGSWVESGDEDAQLEELYRSRLIPSSMPDE